MPRFDDYPYSVIREALGTVVGRVSLIALAMVIGAVMGALTATRSFSDALSLIPELPAFSAVSILYGYGVITFPIILIFGILSIRYTWPLTLTLICTLLMWWNIHKTIRWIAYDSPAAKKSQQLQEDINRALEEAEHRYTEGKKSD